MNINDLKVKDRIKTKWEYSLSCNSMALFMTNETEPTRVSYVSNDYVILSENVNYLLLNSGGLNLVEYE